MSELKVECPKCKHQFGESETFQWVADDNNEPCEEFLQCPKCNVSTEQQFTCEICPDSFNCKLEEACGATLSVSYDDFIKVEIKEQSVIKSTNI